MKEKGITLVALVITVIILLILAGVALSLLSGESNLISKADSARDVYNKEATNEADKLAELDEYLTQYGGDGSGGQNDGMTFGEKYDELEERGQSLIGRIIDYRSVDKDDEIQDAGGWIILGKQTDVPGKNGIIITTTNPVSDCTIYSTLAEWVEYETTINNACKDYVGESGTLGGKDAEIRDIRSITLKDINNAVDLGYYDEDKIQPVTINSVTISESNGGFAYPNEDGTGWILNTDNEYDVYPPTGTLDEAYFYNSSEIYKFGSERLLFSYTWQTR